MTLPSNLEKFQEEILARYDQSNVRPLIIWLSSLKEVQKGVSRKNNSRAENNPRAENDTTKVNTVVQLAVKYERGDGFVLSAGAPPDNDQDLHFPEQPELESDDYMSDASLVDLTSPTASMSSASSSLAPRPRPKAGSVSTHESSLFEAAQIPDKVDRILISTPRRNIFTIRDPMFYFCNGLIIDGKTGRIISVHSPTFSNGFPPEKKISDEYNIYSIHDATTVTFYHYNGKWCISTTMGWDVSTYRWFGERTYAELIYELLSESPEFVAATKLEFTPSGLLLDLRTDRCYTFAFRHHEFHPIRSDPQGIWCLQVTDLDTFQVHTTPEAVPELKGVVWQYPIKNSDIGVPDKAVITREHLTRYIDNALRLACSPHAAVDKFRYGFLFVPKNNPLGRRFILSSDLLRFMQDMVYRRPPSGLIIDAWNRKHFVYIGAYLNRRMRDDFVKLIPDAPLDSYKNIIETFIKTVVNDVNGLVLEAKYSAIPQTPLEKIAREFAKHLYDLKRGTDPMSVTSQIFNPRNIGIFLSLVKNTEFLPQE